MDKKEKKWPMISLVVRLMGSKGAADLMCFSGREQQRESGKAAVPVSWWNAIWQCELDTKTLVLLVRRTSRVQKSACTGRGEHKGLQ